MRFSGSESLKEKTLAAVLLYGFLIFPSSRLISITSQILPRVPIPHFYCFDWQEIVGQCDRELFMWTIMTEATANAMIWIHPETLSWTRSLAAWGFILVNK